MTKYIMAALLSLAALLGAGAYWQTSRLERAQAQRVHLEAAVQQYAGVIEQQVAAKRRSDTALSTRLRAAQAEAQTQKEALNALNQTLEAVPDWAGTPLPEPVARWLRSLPAGAPSP